MQVSHTRADTMQVRDDTNIQFKSCFTQGATVNNTLQLLDLATRQLVG